MGRIRKLMTPDPVWIESSANLHEAVRLMREHDVGGLPVCDSAGRVVGVITDRTLLMGLGNWRTRPSTLGDGWLTRGRQPSHSVTGRGRRLGAGADECPPRTSAACGGERPAGGDHHPSRPSPHHASRRHGSAAVRSGDSVSEPLAVGYDASGKLSGAPMMVRILSSSLESNRDTCIWLVPISSAISAWERCWKKPQLDQSPLVLVQLRKSPVDDQPRLGTVDVLVGVVGAEANPS